MSLTPLLIALSLGAILGLAIGWLMGSRRSTVAPSDMRLEGELRAQVALREKELSAAREEQARITKNLATAQANQAAAERLLAEQRQMHELALREAKANQEKALVDLRDAFKALSADALKASVPEFIRQAEQSFGKFQATATGDLTQRQEAIKGLIDPLKEQLEAYQKRLQQSETSQSTALGEVKKHLESLTVTNQTLASETAQFRSVLKSNQARGKWGEETLRRVVEAAGMSQHCDFTEQTHSGENRPDMVVRLPGERYIIVDAKVPDFDFLSALGSSDEATRAESLKSHVDKLKLTIKALADRDYPHEFPNALDYVVLFLPAESLFSAALEGDRDLIIWAAEKRIMIATPASLIALLRSVSVSWQQHSQTENAQKIAEAARELYSRVVKFTEHFEKIRSGLEKANAAYNDAMGSYQSRVRTAGERLVELGGGEPGKEMPEIKALDGALRVGGG